MFAVVEHQEPLLYDKAVNVKHTCSINEPLWITGSYYSYYCDYIDKYLCDWQLFDKIHNKSLVIKRMHQSTIIIIVNYINILTVFTELINITTN